MPDTLASGLTVRDVSKRYRVSPDKVRAWISRGELRAINSGAALCGKRRRWVIAPDALVAFEQRRAGGPPPKPPRRKKRTTLVDYYP